MESQVDVDDPYVKPGMPWPRKLLIVVAALQAVIIGLQASVILKWPSSLYPSSSSYVDVDLTPVTYQLDDLKSGVEAARNAATDAKSEAGQAHSAALKVSSDLAMQAITGVRCARY